MIALTQAGVMLLIKRSHVPRRWAVSSLPVSLCILWVHETKCSSCSSPFKGHSTGDSCRKMRKTFWLNQKHNPPLSLSLFIIQPPALFLISLHLALPLPLLSSLLLLQFCLFSSTVSLSFHHLPISYSLTWISLPVSPFPVSACLSQTHCSMRLILLAPNAPCSTSSP